MVHFHLPPPPQPPPAAARRRPNTSTESKPTPRRGRQGAMMLYLGVSGPLAAAVARLGRKESRIRDALLSLQNGKKELT